MVFVSAVIEAIVPVATPLEFVTPGCTNVLLLPVEASCTVWPTTPLPFWSRTVTVIVEVAVPLAITPVVGDAVAVVRTALIVLGSPTKSTVGCWATTIWLAPGFTVAAIVLVSAVMLAIVPVATPKASVGPGWTSVLLLPVAARLTAWPATGLPLMSRTVTVIVEVAVPLATTPVAGAAVAVVSVALMLFGSPTNVTVGCCATATWLAPGFAVAVMVFVSAVVVAIVPVVTPLALVTPGCTRMLFEPVLASCTATPTTALPFTSSTVTVIVETAVPSASTPLVGDAVAVDRTALMLFGSPTKVTV